MKNIDIVGENYFGAWTKMRPACRGIIIQNGMILLSYETTTGQCMIPGGGIEDNESESDCCVREICEETGLLVRPSTCVLEIDEYYEEWKYINRYFLCMVTGHSEMKLTEREKQVGMEPRWFPIEEALDIFSRYASYAETDEMRRGMYLREYTALCELLK